MLTHTGIAIAKNPIRNIATVETQRVVSTLR